MSIDENIFLLKMYNAYKVNFSLSLIVFSAYFIFIKIAIEGLFL
jgi:hypothetical protein